MSVYLGNFLALFSSISSEESKNTTNKCGSATSQSISAGTKSKVQKQVEST